MKGGVGKTTISAHVSRELHEAKFAAVLLVDLDPQFNLTQQLVTQKRYENLIAEGKTIMRAFEPPPVQSFFDISVSDDDPPSARDISTTLFRFPNTPLKSLSLIPGSFDLTKYSLIPDPAKLNHAAKYFKHFISNARKEFDIIILDMNPSSSFLTTAGLSVATDIISPVRPDKYSMLGLRLVKQLVDHPSIASNPNHHVIMNVKSRGGPMTNVEKEIRTDAYFGDKIFTSRIFHSGLLEAKSDYTGFASDKKVSNRNRVKAELRSVATELWQRVGL